MRKEFFNKSLPSGRQIHFIDIDNITGSPSGDFSDHLKVRDLYIKETGYSQGDLCFIACAHASAFAVTKVWNDARVYWRSGYNGADYALIDAFSSDQDKTEGKDIREPKEVAPLFSNEVATARRSGLNYFSFSLEYISLNSL